MRLGRVALVGVAALGLAILGVVAWSFWIIARESHPKGPQCVFVADHSHILGMVLWWPTER